MLRVIANTATLWLWLNEKSPLTSPLAGLSERPSRRQNRIRYRRQRHRGDSAAPTSMPWQPSVLCHALIHRAQAASFDSLRLVSDVQRPGSDATVRKSHLGWISTCPVSLEAILIIFLQSRCIATETAERLRIPTAIPCSNASTGPRSFTSTAWS